jgi:hypothetical protein
LRVLIVVLGLLLAGCSLGGGGDASGERKVVLVTTTRSP